MPREKHFHFLYNSFGIYTRIILVCVCNVTGIDIYYSKRISLHKWCCLYRPAVSWQLKAVVVVVVAVVAVCQTRRVLHPCPYQYHGSMGHPVGWQLPHVGCQDTQGYCLVIMGTTAWVCCQVTGVVAVQTREFEAAQTENQEVLHLAEAISQILPLMVKRCKAVLPKLISRYGRKLPTFCHLWLIYRHICKAPLMRGLLHVKFTTDFINLNKITLDWALLQVASFGCTRWQLLKNLTGFKNIRCSWRALPLKLGERIPNTH